MFSKDLEHTIGQCYKRAREARHEFMTVEHLLLALLDNPSAQAVLKACGADADRLRQELEQAIEASVSRLAEDDGRDTQPTLGFQRVLQRAGHRPILLVGGSTGLIGDPKQAGERVMNDVDTVAGWVERIRSEVGGLIDLEGPNAATLVNNLDLSLIHI